MIPNFDIHWQIILGLHLWQLQRYRSNADAFSTSPIATLHASYIHHLPQQLASLPIFFSKAILDELHYAPLMHKIIARNIAISQTYQALQQRTASILVPHLNNASDFTALVNPY